MNVTSDGVKLDVPALRAALVDDLAQRRQLVDLVLQALARLEMLEEFKAQMETAIVALDKLGQPHPTPAPQAAPEDVPPAVQPAPAAQPAPKPAPKPAARYDWPVEELRERVIGEIKRLSRNGIAPSESEFNVRREGIPISRVWRERLGCSYVEMVEAAVPLFQVRRKRAKSKPEPVEGQTAKRRPPERDLTAADIAAAVEGGAELVGFDDEPPTVLHGKLTRETEHMAMSAAGPVRVTRQYIELR